MKRLSPAWTICLLALGLRLGHAVLQGRPSADVGDALEYRAYAINLVESGAYSGPAGEKATRMPGYPVFLSIVRVVLGGSLWAVVVAQCLLGALTCVLLYWLAQRLLSPPWPLYTGLAAAGYYGLFAPCALALSECLYSFLLTLSAWALYREGWTPLRRAAAFGALSGALYLVRPEPLPAVVAVSLLLPSVFRGFGRRETAASLAGFALVAGLWIGRNAFVFRRLMPASSVGKSVAYQSLYIPASRMGVVSARDAAPESLSELEKEEHYTRAYRRLVSLLGPVRLVKAYVYNILNIFYPFLPGYDWTYVLLIPFWLLGLKAAVSNRDLWPVALPVLGSIGIFIFFGGPASRYRQGIAPFLILLAACGASRTGLGPSAASWLAFNLLLWAFQGSARGLLRSVLA